MHTLPKIELHLHLDCSLSWDVVRQLDPTFTPERYAEEIVAPRKCANLADYLARTTKSVALMQTQTALRLAARDMIHQLAADNVIYAEVRFAPLLHLSNGLQPPQIVEWIADEFAQASAETGVTARLILCTLRHFSAEQSMETVKLVERYLDQGVVALDLAGDETGYPLDAHAPAFEYARERGLNRIAHAGEAGGPASVREVLTRLMPSRIGHGVRSIDDPALVDHLIEHDLHLEVCPICNVQIDIYDTLPDHPIDRLYRAGVRLSVNTDARATTQTTLSADYDALADTFGWTHADLLAMNLNAVEASFAPPDLKPVLAERLRAAYNGV